MKILTCKLLSKTLDSYKYDKKIISEFKEFVKFKSEHPSLPYGKKDYSFNKAHDIKHAGLTFDISILYSITQTELKLYGIFSHDESGTGQPKNNNRMDQLVSKINNQEMK